MNGERTAKGRFATGNQAATGVSKAKASKIDGYDGVVAFGGILNDREHNPDLIGINKWRTYARMDERPPVAIWARLRQALFSGITWTAVENESGTAAARKGKEIVEQGMIKARLARPWSMIAADSIHGAAAVGFSIYATEMGRRKDGMVVYTKIEPRPPSTIDRWWREDNADPKTPFAAVEQRLITGQTAILALEQCLYVVNHNGTGSTSPDGVGMKRLIAERCRKLGIYEPLEGSELASSLGGIPITRAPLQEMKAQLRTKLAKGTSAADAVSTIAAALAEKMRPLRDFVAKRFKDPSKLAWFELDSATYEGSDPNTITPIKKWDLEIIKGDLQGLPEIRKIISDLDLDIARMLGIEHAFIGGGQSRGTFSAHESKISAFGAGMNAEVGLFSYISRDQLARRLVAANGLDPDEATPTLQPSPILRTDIDTAVNAITKLPLAGLPPNHPAKKAIFEGVDLPWEEEDETPSMLQPRLPFGGPQPDSTQKPPVDDLADETDTVDNPGDSADLRGVVE